MSKTRIIIKEKDIITSFNCDDVIITATKNTLTFYTKDFKLIKSIFYKNAQEFILNIPFSMPEFLIEIEEDKKDENQ